MRYSTCHALTLALDGRVAGALRGHCVLAATKAAKLQLDPSLAPPSSLTFSVTTRVPLLAEMNLL